MAPALLSLGAEAAIFFASGYTANFAVLTTLPQRGDLLVLDQLVHASIHEGARAGRASPGRRVSACACEATSSTTTTAPRWCTS